MRLRKKSSWPIRRPFWLTRRPANVLLTGFRRTGKSTAVKALVCRYHEQGLRLIQVQRGQLHNLQQLMEKLGDIGGKSSSSSLDDLSFDENEKRV